MFRFKFVPSSLFFVVLLLVLGACTASTRTKAPNELSLVWEAWSGIKESYVEPSAVDAEKASMSIVNAMLDAAGKATFGFVDEAQRFRTRVPRTVPKELRGVWKAWQLINKKWPELDEQQLKKAAMNGLISSFNDPVLAHLTPSEHARAKETLVGKYEGIGASVATDGRSIIIAGVMANGPAQRAGLEPGDVVKSVDGVSLEGMNVEDTVKLVRGPTGTRIILVIERQGEGTKEVAVVRGSVEVPTIGAHLFPGGIIYVSIDRFHDNTDDEFIVLFDRIKQVQPLAYILDLRDNPGGSLDAVRIFGSQFLKDGPFMFEVDSKQKRTDLQVEPGGVVGEGPPVAVLVNEDTSYSAELLAGVFKDRKRAIIVGAPTKGRGTGTEIRELTDGSALSIPVKRWYTPSGNRIEGRGIEPDELVRLTPTDAALGFDRQLRKAYELLNEKLPAFR